MVTVFAVDDETGDNFRNAVREKYGTKYSHIKAEIKTALNNHALKLRGG